MCQPQPRGGGKQLLIHGLYYSLCLVTQMLSLVAPFTLEDFSPCVCLRNTFRPLTHKVKLIHFSFHAMKTKSLLNINVYMKSCLKLQFYQASYLTKLFNLLINNIMNTLNNIWIQTHTHVAFYGLLGLSIGYCTNSMCYCPTPTLHLNLALTADGAFLLSPQNTHSVWFISVLNYGDTENVLINHLLLVIPV